MAIAIRPCSIARMALGLLGAALLTPLAGFEARAQHDAALMRAPEDGGARRWVVAGDNVDIRAAPDAAATVLSSRGRDDLLHSFGCTQDAAWCVVRPVEGGKKGYVRADQLRPAVWQDGTVITGANTTKARARKRDYDANGSVACAQEVGEALGTCKASVARSDGGDATVVVRFANGFARQLYFVQGRFVSASATMSGAGKDTAWSLEDDLYSVRVDDQQYRISKAFVLGE